jgi:WD40 repeat protein
MSFLKYIILALVFIAGVLMGVEFCKSSHLSPQERLAQVEQAEDTPRNLLVGFATLGGHYATVSSLAFSPSGEFLLSSGADDTVRLWNWATGEEVRKIYCHEGGPVSVVWSPSGEEFAVAGCGGTVSLWNVNDGSMKWRSQKREGVIRSLLFDPAGEQIYAGGDDGRVVALNAATGEEQWTAETDLPIRAMALYDGALMAGTAMENNYVEKRVRHARVLSWDAKSGRLLKEMCCPWKISGIAPYYEDKIVVSTPSLLGEVSFYAGGDSWPISLLNEYAIPYPGPIYMIPDTPYVLLGTVGSRKYKDIPNGLRGRVMIHHIYKDEMLDEAGADSYGVSSVAISPDRKIIAAGGYMDGHIVLFRTPDVCFEPEAY